VIAVLALPLAVVVGGAAVRAAVAAWRRRVVVRRLAGGAGDRRADRRRRERSLPAPPARVASALLDAGFDGDPAVPWSAWLAAVGAAAATGMLAGSPGFAVLGAAALAVGAAAGLRTRRGRGDATVERALPAALEAVARGLRSGASLTQALDEAANAAQGSLGAELRRVTREAGHGAGLVDALEQLAVRRPLPGVRLAVAALCLGVETGGAQARAVDGVAVTIRERLAVAAEVQALSSQSRMSALVIGLAPLAFGAFAAATDPRHAEFLFRTPLGLAFVTTGLVLDGLGWLWMQRLTRVDP
jgi:tight adherence protein B